LIEKNEAKIAQVEKAKKKEEDKVTQSFDNKKTAGVVLAIVGGFFCILSLCLMEDLTTCLVLMTIGIIMAAVGGALFIYGKLRKAGASSSEAWDGIAEVFNNIKS
jgi:cell division protein FtsW (lipid II flippase)